MTFTGVSYPIGSKPDDLIYITDDWLSSDMWGLLKDVNSRHIVVTRKAFQLMPDTFEVGRTFYVADDPKKRFCELAKTIPLDKYDFGYRGKIGEHISPSAVVKNAWIGHRCTIGPNVVIGGDGFGFVQDPESGVTHKFPQVGKVVIGNHVEIQAGTCVARGALTDTIIEDHVKIDQLCHIAHGCHIKEGAILTAGVILSGSVTIGPWAWIGVNSCIKQGITIGEHALVGMGSVVLEDVEPHTVVVGNPARYLRDR